MHKLIKKLKEFRTRILETEFCKSIINRFNSEDAEYLDQVHQKKSIQRVYDDSVMTESTHQNTPVESSVSNTSHPNFDVIISEKTSKHTSTHSHYCNNPETRNANNSEAVNIFTIDDNPSLIHRGLDETLTYPDEFASDESVELIQSFLTEPAEETFTTQSDEIEWLTPNTNNFVNDEDIWEGSLPSSVAIESPPTRRELANLPDRLTRAERAMQIAIKIGEEFDWDKTGIQLLASIFERYWWSSSQAAMKRAIESGMTPQELILAEELRQMWVERPEFWSALNKLGEICHQNHLLSWPAALKLIRGFNGYPQIEEIEALLNECFERWISTPSLQYSFKGFYMYALYRVGAYDDLADQDGWIIFDHYQTDETEVANEIEQTKKLHYLGVNIDPQVERYVTNSWDGQLVLLNARHGHESLNEEDNLSSELEEKEH